MRLVCSLTSSSTAINHSGILTVVGWPTGGSNYGAAVPGVKAAQTFWSNAVCGMLDWGVNVFYFEAFDEPWKPVSTGDDGTVADETHWGAWNSDRSSKFDYTC